MKRVRTSTAHQTIIAQRAEQRIITRAPHQHIVTAAAIQRIMTRTTGQHIIANMPVQQVITLTTDKHIITATALQCVIPRTAGQIIVAVFAVQIIVAGTCLHSVIQRSGKDHGVCVVGRKQVVDRLDLNTGIVLIGSPVLRFIRLIRIQHHDGRHRDPHQSNQSKHSKKPVINESPPTLGRSDTTRHMLRRADSE